MSISHKIGIGPGCTKECYHRRSEQNAPILRICRCDGNKIRQCWFRLICDHTCSRDCLWKSQLTGLNTHLCYDQNLTHKKLTWTSTPMTLGCRWLACRCNFSAFGRRRCVGVPTGLHKGRRWCYDVDCGSCHGSSRARRHSRWIYVRSMIKPR